VIQPSGTTSTANSAGRCGDGTSGDEDEELDELELADELEQLRAARAAVLVGRGCGVAVTSAGRPSCLTATPGTAALRVSTGRSSGGVSTTSSTSCTGPALQGGGVGDHSGLCVASGNVTSSAVGAGSAPVGARSVLHRRRGGGQRRLGAAASGVGGGSSAVSSAGGASSDADGLTHMVPTPGFVSNAQPRPSASFK